MKINTAIFLSILFLISCSEQKESKKQVGYTERFNTFELTFENPTIEKNSFSVLVDSNKIYISAGLHDTAYYGLLPDSVYNLIPSAISKIRSNQTNKSNDHQCIDCSVLAIKIVENKDTIKVKQQGELSKELIPLINSMQAFLKQGRHEMFIARIYMLETSRMAEDYQLMYPFKQK